MPLLSIITVCKDPGFSIVETTQSVLSQQFRDYEYIVIDSLSSDGTSEYLQDLYRKKKIHKLIIEKDQGIYQAINKGIRIAKGSYVGLIHAGDTYCANIFQKLTPYLNIKADVLYGSAYIINEKNAYSINMNKNSHLGLKKKNSIIHTATFVKKSLHQKIGLYNEKFIIAGDFDFFKKALYKNFKFIQVPYKISNLKFGGISTRISYVTICTKECAEVVFGKNFSLKKLQYLIVYFFEAIIYLIIKKISNQIKTLSKMLT